MLREASRWLEQAFNKKLFKCSRTADLTEFAFIDRYFASYKLSRQKRFPN